MRLPSAKQAGRRQTRFNLEEELVREMDTAVAALALTSRLELVRRAVAEFLDRNQKPIEAYKRLRKRHG